MQVPTIGRVVLYRSRTGRYDVPAIITATVETLDPQGVELYLATEGTKGVPPLDSPEHVHLTVLTPGIPGFRAEGLAGAGDTPLAVRDQSGRPVPAQGIGENAGGSYQEWNVPLDAVAGVNPSPAAGSWRWPQIRMPGLEQARQTQPRAAGERLMEAMQAPAEQGRSCVHDSTRSDGMLDNCCLRCGADGYWHNGFRHDRVHPSGKILFALDGPSRPDWRADLAEQRRKAPTLTG